MGIRSLVCLKPPRKRGGFSFLQANVLFNYMQKAVLLKVKAGEWENWKGWCEELSTTLLTEAITTLEEEKVVQELTLGFEIDNQRYVIGFMDGECLPANMDREINQKHKAMRVQCLEYVCEAEVLSNIKS